jgi:multicomponent Na+:H+ antiporter subunit E
MKTGRMAEKATVKRPQPWFRGQDLAQGALLLLLWIVFSGRLDAFHLATGVVAAVFVVWLDRKLGPATLADDGVPMRLHLGRFLLYIPWLTWQMLVSSYQVALAILRPREHVNPRLVSFRSRQPHIIAKVVLGNSITLTPGTLTLDIDGDRYLVHSLSDASTDGLISGEMQLKVARLFRGDETEPVTDIQILRGDAR